MKKLIAAIALAAALTGCTAGMGGGMNEIINGQLDKGPMIQGN